LNDISNDIIYFITIIQMINIAAGSAQVPTQANSRTDDDGEAAFNEDAFEESEHVSDIMLGDNVETEQNTVEDEGGMPNNDFCFTEDDFIETRQQMNDAVRHQGTYMDAWSKIKALENHELTVTSSKGGALKWKVVPSVVHDDFEVVRQEEEKYIQSKQSVYIDESKFSPDNFYTGFCELWPKDIDDELTRLNRIIQLDNIKRKESYQKVIRKVKKSEYIIFHAILIGATAYSEQGEALWQTGDECEKKNVRRGLSQTVDFGKFMKCWRFRQIKKYIAEVMEDHSIKETDDWWRFKGRVEDFNVSRKKKVFKSHIFVFDESMSAFIPR